MYNDYQQQSAMNRAEDKALSPPEDPPILCDDCGEDVSGQEHYEICNCIFCADCIDKFKTGGS